MTPSSTPTHTDKHTHRHTRAVEGNWGAPALAMLRMPRALCDTWLVSSSLNLPPAIHPRSSSKVGQSKYGAIAIIVVVISGTRSPTPRKDGRQAAGRQHTGCTSLHAGKMASKTRVVSPLTYRQTARTPQAFSALARARGVASLNHEVPDVAVEDGAVVVTLVCQPEKVLGRAWHHVAVDLQVEHAQ